MGINQNARRCWAPGHGTYTGRRCPSCASARRVAVAIPERDRRGVQAFLACCKALGDVAVEKRYPKLCMGYDLAAGPEKTVGRVVPAATPERSAGFALSGELQRRLLEHAFGKPVVSAPRGELQGTKGCVVVDELSTLNADDVVRQVAKAIEMDRAVARFVFSHNEGAQCAVHAFLGTLCARLYAIPGVLSLAQDYFDHMDGTGHYELRVRLAPPPRFQVVDGAKLPKPEGMAKVTAELEREYALQALRRDEQAPYRVVLWDLDRDCECDHPGYAAVPFVEGATRGVVFGNLPRATLQARVVQGSRVLWHGPVLMPEAGTSSLTCHLSP